MKRPWAFICASEGATSKHLRNYCREVYLLGYLPVCPKLQDSQYLVLEDAVERSEYTAIVRDKLLRCQMEDEMAVPPGSMGTVDFIDDAGQIHMNWDCGRSLALIPGVDSFSRLPSSKEKAGDAR